MPLARQYGGNKAPGRHCFGCHEEKQNVRCRNRESVESKAGSLLWAYSADKSIFSEVLWGQMSQRRDNTMDSRSLHSEDMFLKKTHSFLKNNKTISHWSSSSFRWSQRSDRFVTRALTTSASAFFFPSQKDNSEMRWILLLVGVMSVSATGTVVCRSPSHPSSPSMITLKRRSYDWTSYTNVNLCAKENKEERCSG